MPIFIYVFMNGWWEIFAVDDTALGGYMALIARLIEIGIYIVVTLYNDVLVTCLFPLSKSIGKNIID